MLPTRKTPNSPSSNLKSIPIHLPQKPIKFLRSRPRNHKAGRSLHRLRVEIHWRIASREHSALMRCDDVLVRSSKFLCINPTRIMLPTSQSSPFTPAPPTSDDLTCFLHLLALILESALVVLVAQCLFGGSQQEAGLSHYRMTSDKSHVPSTNDPQHGLAWIHLARLTLP